MQSDPVTAPTTTVPAELGRIMRLAWPVSLANLGSMLMGVVDVLMVGQLGELALSQVSLGHTFAFAVQLPIFGFAIGLDPLFAQAFGAGRPGAARRTLLRAMLLAAVASVPIAAAHLACGPLLSLMGQDPGIVAGATPYVWIRTLGILPFAAFVLLRHHLQGAGRMWPGTLAVVLGNVVNVIVNALLVFGLFGFPRLEAVGAAWATVLSTVAMLAVIGLAHVLHARERGPVEEGPPTGTWRGMLSVATPVAAQVSLEGWGFSVATVLVGVFGETALAAHTVAITLASLAFMLPLGVSSAAATRIGNLMGAGHGWVRSAWLSIGVGVAVMTGSAVLFAGVPRPLASLFVGSPEAIEFAAVLLPVAAGFALFDGVQVVTFGVLRGAGDTAVPALANIVGYYVVGLPLGAFLAFGLGFGAVGVWYGLALALACIAGLLLIRLVSTARRGGFHVVG